MGTTAQVSGTFPVTDAPAKASGKLAYGTDLVLPGMLHVTLVLSARAHATIARVDTAAALALPGVVAVFDHRHNPPRRFCRYRLVAGQAGCIDDEQLFATVARFVGDRVAAVVATSQAAADAGARAVTVTYEDLPPVFDANTALAADAPVVHPGGNLVSSFDHRHGAGVPTERVPADWVEMTTSVATQRLHHAAIEPHMAAAGIDASGLLTLWTTGQSVYGVRTVVAGLFDLPDHRIRVVKVPTGGSFGGKQEFILEPVVALLTLMLRRPVRLVLSREQCVAATMVRPTQTTTTRTVATAAGRLQSVALDTVLDAGAYASSSPDYAEAMAHKLGRLYAMPSYWHSGRVAYTNTPVAGGFRGWGAPDVITSFELHMAALADRLGIDPVALRRINLVRPGAIDPTTGESVGDARIVDCLDRGADLFDWATKSARPAGTGRFRYGVGVAVGAHKNGMLSAAWVEATTMTLRVNDVGTLTLAASLHEMGGGVGAMMQVLVAEVLAVGADAVDVSEADTANTPYDFGCYGSRMTYVCGAAAVDTAQLLAGMLCDAASTLWSLPADQLHLADGAVWGPGNRTISFAELSVAYRLATGGELAITNSFQARSNPGAYCAQFAEVELDVLTGLVRVLGVLAVADVGRAINVGMVVGQYTGAIQAGVGAALCEEVVLDAAGAVAGGGFKDYHLTNMAGMPPVTVAMIEHAGDDGPYGAKSVGEIAFVPTAAAIVNAVNHALAGTAPGARITTLPATPERIVAALTAVGFDPLSVLSERC